MSEQLAVEVPGPKAWWERLFREPARPDWVRRRPSAPWLVVATVCIGAFMGQLDASIVTLAIPSIKTDMNASLAQVEWVALIYLLVLVGSISAIGRLADMLGRKLLYTYGFGLFTLASLGCALAPDITWLLVARAVQAVGAGGWRWVFYVNIPAGIIGLVLGWFLLPRTHVKAPKVRLDWAGLLLLMPATGALLLALSEASRLGFANPIVAALLAAALVLFTVFVLWERRAPHPLVDMGLFRTGTFSRGITTGLLSYLVLFGVLFVTPLYLEAAHSMPPVRAGLLLTILPIGLALIAPAAGTLADRLGARVPTTVGMALAAGSLVVLAFSGGNPWLAGTALGGIGVGLGLFTPANNATVAAAGHTHQAGMVSGVMNMTRGVGTSLGVAFGAVLYVLASGTATGGHASAASAGFQLAIGVFAAVALLAAIVAVSGKRRAAA